MKRLDLELVKRGLVSTRARAQAMILAGHVLVNDQPVTKAGTSIQDDDQIRLREPELKYVSRGALKLKGALEQFDVSVEGLVALDVGASTGGFTEVLLERGAKKVYAIDVGTNQLAWKIRSDPRVDVREKVNARDLKPEWFSEPIQVAVMDVSFISTRLILPGLVSVLEPGAHLIVLFKPQFEMGREAIGEGGIVRSQAEAEQAFDAWKNAADALSLIRKGSMISPIQGTDGNTEYLAYWTKA